MAKVALVTNLALSIMFVFSNLLLWSQINGNGYSNIISSNWNPLTILAMHYGYTVGGEFTSSLGISQYPNLPFWIFFVAIVANLYFIIYLINKANAH